MKEIIAEAGSLTKRYGRITALNNVNLRVRRGEILGLVGDNGSGKSTFLKLLAGQIFPTEGEVRLFGAGTERELARQRRRVGTMIETPGFYPQLTVERNLEYYRIQKGIPGKEQVRNILRQIGLYERRKTYGKQLSLGMKQRLGLAGALLGRPPILILDEPTNGLDPSGIHEIRNLVKSLPDLYDCTILISSHMLSEIELIADDIGILNHGRLLFEGSLDELRQSALRAGFAADNLEDMFLSMVEKDNAARKQRAQL